MKKIHLLCIFALIFTISCSSDNDQEDLIIPGQPKNGEIQLIYDASSFSTFSGFSIQAKDITIDWGDGEIQQLPGSTSSTELTHEYKNSKTYTISIKAIDIQSLADNGDVYSDLSELSTIKGLYIGESIEIGDVKLISNGLEKIQIPSNSKIRYLRMDVNSEFNFEQLNNCLLSSVSLDLWTNIGSINLNNNNILGLTVRFIDLITIEKLDLKACKNLNYLHISNYNPIDIQNTKRAEIKDIQLQELSSLKTLKIINITIEKLDLSTITSLYTLSLTNIETKEPINLGEGAQDMAITEFNQIQNRITSLDISKCKNLSTLKLGNLQALKSIKFGGIKNLIIVEIGLCDKLKSLDCQDLSDLFLLSYIARNKQDALESLNIENATNLEILRISGTNLTTITSGNNHQLHEVSLYHNNMGESTLIDFINKLDDTPLSGPKRELKLFGNTGYTTKVQNSAKQLNNWSLIDPE
ncbi:hypothetical protein [Dysgonomonas sp. ZJ709]|uniref:hypothetical protein n=1 Tax=Dysgonomonas sp. ZJ709 TaxID=2709797 RepID=UPI0013EB811E|nr:hypothetical protein [Dysgonomonas sp. ZJ709]